MFKVFFLTFNSYASKQTPEHMSKYSNSQLQSVSSLFTEKFYVNMPLLGFFLDVYLENPYSKLKEVFLQSHIHLSQVISEIMLIQYLNRSKCTTISVFHGELTQSSTANYHSNDIFSKRQGPSHKHTCVQRVGVNGGPDISVFLRNHAHNLYSSFSAATKGALHLEIMQHLF